MPKRQRVTLFNDNFAVLEYLKVQLLTQTFVIKKTCQISQYFIYNISQISKSFSN